MFQIVTQGINDRLVKLRPLIDQTCFEFISVSYFVVCYFSVEYLSHASMLLSRAQNIPSITSSWLADWQLWQL